MDDEARTTTAPERAGTSGDMVKATPADEATGQSSAQVSAASASKCSQLPKLMV